MGNPSLLVTARCDLVVHSESELQFAAEVMFCRLDRHVTEDELDVSSPRLDDRDPHMCVADRGAQLIDSDSLRRSLDDLPKAPSASCPRARSSLTC